MPLLTDLETPSTSIGLRAETTPEPTTPVSLPSETELNSISLTEGETPLLITGEDGTIYQVAGQNEDGQTILIAQDADGQQQCLLVASESTSELTEGGAVATPAVVTAEAQEQQLEEPMVINTEPESDTAEDSQIVAQIVSAQPPSPGKSFSFLVSFLVFRFQVSVCVNSFIFALIFLNTTDNHHIATIQKKIPLFLLVYQLY